MIPVFTNRISRVFKNRTFDGYGFRMSSRVTLGNGDVTADR